MLTVFADGSSSGRADKPGGWGWIVARDRLVLLAGYGGWPIATNNQMELQGAIEGLMVLARCEPLPDEPIRLVSDSQYVLGLASGKSNPTKNVEQAKLLRSLALQWGVTTEWVRGHTLKRGEWKTAPFEVLMNNRADQLAKKGKLENTKKEEDHVD